MTLEQRVEALEQELLRSRLAINDINCAFDALSASVRQQLRVNDEAAQKQTAVSRVEIYAPKFGIMN